MLILLLTLFTGAMSHWDYGRDSYTAVQQSLFLALNRDLAFAPARLWSNLTQLGNAAVLIPLISPLFVYRTRILAAVFSSIPLAGLLSVAGKRLTDIPRPAAVLDISQFTIIGDTLAAHNSFPSGHSITVFTGVVAVCATLIPQPESWRHVVLLLAAMLIASAVCLSRVAVGAHWPLDLVAGAACGWLAGINGLALTENYPRWWKSSENRWGCCLLALIVSGLCEQLVETAIEVPFDAPVLWISALCGTVTVICLIRAALIGGNTIAQHAW